MILEPIPFLAGILFLILSVNNLRQYWLYKKGHSREDAVVKKILWKPAAYMRFKYLFDKESPVITYQFRLNGKLYEKTEEAFMQFIKGSIKEGSSIKVYIPKGNNPNRVTIVNPLKKNKVKAYIVLSIMSTMLIIIAFIAK